MLGALPDFSDPGPTWTLDLQLWGGGVGAIYWFFHLGAILSTRIVAVARLLLNYATSLLAPV